MNGNDCSWPGNFGRRKFGRFLRWDGEFAIVRMGARIGRVHKSKLTFERD